MIPVYEHDGLTLTIHQWAARTGIGVETLRWRLKTGWTEREAFTTPAGVPRPKREDETDARDDDMSDVNDVDVCLHCTKQTCSGYCRKFPRPDDKSRRRRRKAAKPNGGI
jgi:hypothetical protein